MVFESCRSIYSGINYKKIDLNLLRANSLYSSSVPLDYIEELIRINDELNGWLIFYTHDVCDNPTAVGCTPDYLEDVIKIALKSKAVIKTINRIPLRI